MAKKPRVGFIGLGIMGMAMAKNTKKAGFPVVVTNRSEPRRQQARKEGLTVLNSPKDVTASSDVVIVMVTDSGAVRDVVLGKEGIFEADSNKKTVFQMSTIDEKSTIEIAGQVRSRGMKFLDCPVMGSKKQVETGQLIILAGGDESLVEENRDLFQSMGKAIVKAGAVGKGTALKLCMNLIVAQMTTALSESVSLARVQELDAKKIFEVISESPAINCGYYKIKQDALMNEEFSPAFSLENMLKDVRIMDSVAKEKRLPLPVTQAVRFLMENAMAEGYGAEDLTCIAKVLKPKVVS